MAQAIAPRESIRESGQVRGTRPAWLRTTVDVLRTYPFLLPAIFFFVGWQILPIYDAFRLSFTDEKFLSGQPAQWIGLQNYRDLIHDHLFWQGIERAFIFTCLFVPGMILIPMVIAVMIDRVTSTKLATTYRLILLLPSMIPAPLIFVLWGWMYNNYVGPINYFLTDIFHFFNLSNQPQYVSSQHLVFFAIAIMEWWWGIGYHTMFFLAGLSTIPRDLFDSARVDGAGEWRLFWGITVWRLMPIILVLAVIRFGTAMAVVDEYIIVGGFTKTLTTYTWTVYMYDTAFGGGLQFRGYAAAIGWGGALIMLIIVSGMFYLFRSRD
jgi:ABC-type sugar transport system permease subunit